MVLHQITVRRGALLEDAYAALRDVGGSVRGRLVVAFVNEAGLEEAGLDHGGLVKAFLEEAVREGFAADRWGGDLLAVLPVRWSLHSMSKAARVALQMLGGFTRYELLVPVSGASCQ